MIDSIKCIQTEDKGHVSLSMHRTAIVWKLLSIYFPDNGNRSLVNREGPFTHIVKTSACLSIITDESTFFSIVSFNSGAVICTVNITQVLPIGRRRQYVQPYDTFNLFRH